MTRSGAESRLVAEIRAKLGKRGWYAWKNHGNQYAQAGLPDIMAVKDGQLLCIEAKVGSNKPTKIQQVTLERLAAHGALTTVAYSWADVESALLAAQATPGSNSEDESDAKPSESFPTRCFLNRSATGQSASSYQAKEG